MLLVVDCFFQTQRKEKIVGGVIVYDVNVINKIGFSKGSQPWAGIKKNKTVGRTQRIFF